MKKHFFSHLVEVESLEVSLQELDLTDEQKVHLMGIFESSLYHAVLDAILSELAEEDKKVFLEHVAKEDNLKIWKFLNTKIEKIEEKIKKTADELKKELEEDITETKSL